VVEQSEKYKHNGIKSALLVSRYGLIILGSCFLMIASAFFAPLGPGYGTAGRGLATVCTGAAGLGLLVAAGVKAPARACDWLTHSTWLRRLIVPVALGLTLGSLFGLTGMAWLVLHAPPTQSYFTDIISLSQVNADLVLSGRNPYTSDSTYRLALASFPEAMATPLRGPVFGTGYIAPGLRHLQVVQRRYVAAPQKVPDAFDPRTLHSYPALSFLLYVPWVRAGGTNILLVNLLVYWAIFAWLVWLTPAGWRHWGALVLLAGMPVVTASLIESNEVICIALVLVAWHLRERLWIGAVLLGLACAFKQYSWYFVPLFAVEVVRGQGRRAGLRWAGIGVTTFLLPNLPFLLASPKDWLLSQAIPLTDPFFPMGMGIIQFSTSRILPFGPPALYALLEAVTVAAVLWIFARDRTRIGASGLVLALLPLFFAFRSMPNYFAFAPWLALYAVNVHFRAGVTSQLSPVTKTLHRTWHGLLRALHSWRRCRRGIRTLVTLPAWVDIVSGLLFSYGLASGRPAPQSARLGARSFGSVSYGGKQGDELKRLVHGGDLETLERLDQFRQPPALRGAAQVDIGMIGRRVGRHHGKELQPPGVYHIGVADEQHQRIYHRFNQGFSDPQRRRFQHSIPFIFQKVHQCKPNIAVALDDQDSHFRGSTLRGDCLGRSHSPSPSYRHT
jgi:hypothetical protein